MFRKDIVIPSGAVALALCVFSIQADPLKPTQYGDFDRYVLALSWQTGFCQSMVEPLDALRLRHSSGSEYAGSKSQPQM